MLANGNSCTGGVASLNHRLCGYALRTLTGFVSNVQLQNSHVGLVWVDYDTSPTRKRGIYDATMSQTSNFSRRQNPALPTSARLTYKSSASLVSTETTRPFRAATSWSFIVHACFLLASFVVCRLVLLTAGYLFKPQG